MSHLGRDFSSFQGNLTDADCEGIDFAYVKITEGDSYKNPFAPQQVGILQKHGAAVGFYHFFQPGISVADQIHNFSTMAMAMGGSKLPLALDSEVPSNLGWPDLAAKMMDFATQVEHLTNFVPNPRSILYVDIAFHDALQGFPWGRWVWLADPNPGAPHRACLILQGAPRPVSGTDTKVVDPDTFVGSDVDWTLFTGGVASAPAPTVTVSAPVAENIFDVELTLTPGLDPHGNGWYVIPQIPDVTKVDSITWLGNDPASGQPYAQTPEWYVDPAKGAIVLTGGVPGGEYACIIHVRQ